MIPPVNENPIRVEALTDTVKSASAAAPPVAVIIVPVSLFADSVIEEVDKEMMEVEMDTNLCQPSRIAQLCIQAHGARGDVRRAFDSFRNALLIQHIDLRKENKTK